mmetsp:Transcript_29047/g.25689  ORF Transcript_29047/g.25689 Transcript_29047/m.25689 type:complete len:305 (+) Transcript_29047:3-917(+)
MTTCGPYICKETLGKGGYATVKLAEHSETGKEVALKIMRKKSISPAFDELVKNEITIMKELSHQNIIKVLDYSEEALYTLPDGRSMNVYYIALELAENGEIFDFIADTGRFSEELANYFFHQMIEAIEFMHQKDISHRDIKPENILLDKNYNIKLTDFGFAECKETSSIRKGTTSYMAPEMHHKDKFETKPLDIFALGIVLFIMIKGCPPCTSAKYTDQHYKLFMTSPEKFWNAHFRKFKSDFPSSSLIEMLSKMLSPDPEIRISLEEIKNSDWYNQTLLTPEEVNEIMTLRKVEMSGDQEMEI